MSSTLTQTLPVELPSTLRLLKALHPHAVVLHEDTYHQNCLDAVATIVQGVVQQLSIEEAQTIVTTAFTTGREVVITCPREAAEHYQVCLSVHGLTVTVEAH